MEKTNEELKEAGIPDPRNSDVKYELVNYNSTEANKEVEDVKIWILISIIFIGSLFIYLYSKDSNNDLIQRQFDSYPAY